MIKNKRQFYIGVALLLGAITLGFLLNSTKLTLNLFLGMGIGYTLTRGYFGFAGTVNRAYSTGSTKLARYVLLLFLLGATFTAIALTQGYSGKLNVYPINIALFVGATLFGIGMAFGKGCGSGTLTGMRSNLGSGLVLLFFFGIGVFLGYPLQAKYGKVGNSVFFPDLFGSDPLIGSALALLLTFVLVMIFVALTFYVQKKLIAKGKSGKVDIEEIQDTLHAKDYTFFEKVFVKPFTLLETTLVLSGVLGILMLVNKPWGVTTTFGFWFAKILMLFGASAESLGDFAVIKDAAYFSTGLLESSGSVQNIGLIIGAFIFPLLAGAYKFRFKISRVKFLQLAIGGLTMGIGTRLANGCNAGALYSGITSLSLAGWIYLVFMVIGAIGGNYLIKRIFGNK